MQERVWRKGNPLCTAGGNVNGTAAVKNNMEIIKNLNIELHTTQQSHYWTQTLRKP